MAYATRSDLKTFGLSDATNPSDAALDPVLDWFLATTSDEMDKYCKQTLGYSGTPVTESLPALIDAQGKLLIYPATPVVKNITAISYAFEDLAPYGAAPPQQTLLPGDAQILNHERGARIRMRNPYMLDYRNEKITVTLTYQKGYPLTLDSTYPVDFQVLPRSLVKACAKIAWDSYKSKDNQNQGSAIPELGVVLFPNQWDVVSVKTLKDFKNMLGGGR